MITITGQGVSSGRASAPIYLHRRRLAFVRRYHVDSSDAEIERYNNARAAAIRQLDKLQRRAYHVLGRKTLGIFRIHQMMVSDSDYTNTVYNVITDQLVNAETAVWEACEKFVGMFESMDDEYMRSRSADVRDISERLLAILSGINTEQGQRLPGEVIVAAEELAPSELFSLWGGIEGIVTEHGDPLSHTAILASAMGIPAIFGAKGIMRPDFDGAHAELDATAGVITINN